MTTDNQIEVEELDDEEKMLLALAKHLDCDKDDLSVERYKHYDLTIISCGRSQYAIGTDEEADSSWDQALDSYLDECVLGEIKDDTLKRYFDRDAWKRDAKYDGRGHCLSSYDGNENEEGEFYIYQIN